MVGPEQSSWLLEDELPRTTGGTGWHLRLAGLIPRECPRACLNPVDRVNRLANILGSRTFGDHPDELLRIHVFSKGKCSFVPFVRIRAPELQGVSGDHETTHALGVAPQFLPLPCALQGS